MCIYIYMHIPASVFPEKFNSGLFKASVNMHLLNKSSVTSGEVVVKRESIPQKKKDY